MDTKIKEILLERFEVMSRASDDSTYILTDTQNLSDEEIQEKIYVRLKRINTEAEEIEELLSRYFTPTAQYIAEGK